MARIERSIVEYYAEHERYRCGYCGSSDTNYSHGMWAHAMTVQDYQDLIDRGWRRSGKYCYKPTMNLTCCPQYTIRCDALNFQPSKSHRKIIKRVNRYLITGQKPGVHEPDATDPSGSGPCGDSFVPVRKSELSLSAGDVKLNRMVNIHPEGSGGGKGKGRAEQLGSGDSAAAPLVAPDKGLDNSKPPCRKAKEIRLERKMKKTGLSLEEIKAMAKHNKRKSLEDLLYEPQLAENPAHRLEIRLVRSNPASKEFLQTNSQAHRVYHKYQTTIHKDPPAKPSMQQYTRFLVDSPLKPLIPKAGEAGIAEGYGSFHQHYLLDGKLIAVGVVDILPHCLSSVYLYYDPDYNFLSLGTYSALRELAFVRELHKQDPNLKYYYMGFYIHSCPKMRYKGQYCPSFLLCPEAYSWVPIERCIPKLATSRYARLEEPGKADPDGAMDIDQVLVLHDQEVMSYEVYCSINRYADDTVEVTEYATLAGMTCAKKMLLFRK